MLMNGASLSDFVGTVVERARAGGATGLPMREATRFRALMHFQPGPTLEQSMGLESG